MTSDSLSRPKVRPVACEGPQRRFLWVAAAIFLSFKLAWILVPPLLTGAPRLGDDSLVYLWWSKSSIIEPHQDAPAIKDIVALRRIDDGNPGQLDWKRARVTMRTAAIWSSPFFVVIGFLLKTGLSHAVVFAIAETFIATVLVIAIANYLTALLDKASAAWGAFFLTFAILPLQGLHYLIPSVLALSIGLLLFSELSRQEPRTGLIFVLATIALSVHSIGLVYVGIAAAYVVLDRCIINESKIPVAEVGALIAGFLIARLVDVALGGKKAPTTGIGEINIWKIDENLNSAATFVQQSILGSPHIWILGILGIAYAVRLKKLKSLTLLGLLVGVFFISTGFNLDGYPGELPARILVCTLILLAGLAGTATQKLLNNSIVIRSAVFLLIAAGTTYQASVAYLMFHQNINGRPFMYNEGKIKADIAELPTTSAIVWADSENAMMVALLEGAWRFRSLPYSMIDGSPQADAIISKWRPTYLAGALPDSLNTLSALRVRSFSRRFYGVDFNNFIKVKINFQERNLKDIYLQFSGNVPLEALHVVLSTSGSACPKPELRQFDVSKKTWVAIDLTQCPGGTELEVKTSRSLAILGIQTQRPSSRVNWPWGSRIFLTAIPRKEGLREIVVDFSFRHLFGATLYRKLAARHHIAVTSDDSGIVWAKLTALSN